MGFSRWQLVTMGLLVGLGLCGILFMTTANTRLQLISPPSLRGRVMGIYTLAFFGLLPVGGWLLGQLAEWCGQPLTLAEVPRGAAGQTSSSGAN